MILKWLCSSELPFSLAAPDVDEEEKLAKLQEEALVENYKLCITDNVMSTSNQWRCYVQNVRDVWSNCFDEGLTKIRFLYLGTVHCMLL